LVRGRARPGRPGALPDGVWDRTVYVEGLSPYFEACNIAYDRSAFDAVGGFDDRDPVTGRPIRPPFGEDVVLGWRIRQRGGGVVFAGEAVVYHRYLPATYVDWLKERRRSGGFPA